jgi:hypothetical protein
MMIQIHLEAANHVVWVPDRDLLETLEVLEVPATKSRLAVVGAGRAVVINVNQSQIRVVQLGKT